MLKRLATLTACFGVLVGCVATTEDVTNNKKVTQISNIKPANISYKSSTLESWWSFFGDPILDKLVSSAISLNSKDEVKKTLSSANPSYDDLRDFYRSPEIELILAVTRNYIDYRYVQDQIYFLTSHINDQKTLLSKSSNSNDKLIKKLKSEQIKSLNKKLALEAQANQLLNKITILTNLLPEYVAQILKEKANIPNSDIMPVLASPTSVVANSPDVLAAIALSGNNITINKYNIFPDISVSKFFGISDEVYINSDMIWNASVGKALNNLNFKEVALLTNGRELEENIKNIVTNIEHAIISYTHMQEQYNVLKNTAKETNKQYLNLKQKNHSPDFASFIKLSEAAYNNNLAALRAEYEKIKIAIKLYETLGAY